MNVLLPGGGEWRGPSVLQELTQALVERHEPTYIRGYKPPQPVRFKKGDRVTMAAWNDGCKEVRVETVSHEDGRGNVRLRGRQGWFNGDQLVLVEKEENRAA